MGRFRGLSRVLVSVVLLLCGGLGPVALGGRGLQISIDRARGIGMLRAIKGDIQKHYYESGFHGVDVEGRFKAAEEKIQTANIRHGVQPSDQLRQGNTTRCCIR